MDCNITTKDSLIKVFNRLGMTKGMDVMLHSSMKSLGYVVNGPLDVIDALLESVGDAGTVLMPAHTGQLTDPIGWKSPAIPAEFIETFRNSMKPFDAKTTPIRNRGIIPETFLTYPGVYRSNHPLNSVSAKGSRAQYYTQEHPLHASEGIDSPTGKLYLNNGYIILLGVTLYNCTAIHLAEYLADVPYLKQNPLKVLIKNSKGSNEFVRLERYSWCPYYNLEKVGHDLTTEGIFKEEDFQLGRLSFFPLKPVVDFVVDKLKKDENYLTT